MVSMNLRRWIGGCAALVAVLGADIARSQDVRSQDENQAPTRITEVRRASQLLKHNVVNVQNEKLGAIKDIVIDQKGKARYVIVDHGGILADKYVAVPWNVMKPKFDGQHCVLDMSVEKLRGAPNFERGNYNDRWTKDWCTKVHAYFGDAKAADSTDADSTKEPELFYASQIIGGTIQNKDDRKIAKGEDIVFDSSDRAAYIAVSSGGTLGVGKSCVCVPFKVMELQRGERGTVFGILNMTAAQLEAAPVCKSDCRDLLDVGYLTRTNKYFEGFAKR